MPVPESITLSDYHEATLCEATLWGPMARKLLKN